MERVCFGLVLLLASESSFSEKTCRSSAGVSASAKRGPQHSPRAGELSVPVVRTGPLAAGEGTDTV